MKFITDPYEAFRGLSDTTVKRAVWSAALLLSATLLPFLLVPFEDFRYCDETYQAYCCTDYERAYLGMLSFFIGNIWMRLFGESLISLRVLMTICYIASVAIGCIYVRVKGFSILKTSLVYFLGVFGVIISYLPLYGWDAGAYPFTALGILALFLYLDHPNRKRATYIGVAAGLMALSRLPLLAFLPICYFLIYFYRHKLIQKNTSIISLWVSDIITVTAAFIITFIAMTVLMVGGPMDYFSAISPGNTVASHSLSDIDWIFDRCIEHAYGTYTMLLPGCIAILLACYYTKAKKHSIWLIIFTALILYYFLRGSIWNQDNLNGFFWSNTGIIIPAAFIAIFFGSLYQGTLSFKGIPKQGTIPSRQSTVALILVSLALLQAFGSNSPIERIGWGLVMVFSFGAYSEHFAKVPRFTFYFLSFSAVVTFGFFALKVYTLSNMYGKPINVHYATRYNGARPIGNDFYIVESVDSIKFIADNLGKQGLRRIVVGRDLNAYNFSFGEKGENAGMLFDVFTDDLYRDYNKQNVKRDAAVIVCLNIKQDTVFEQFLEREKYRHIFSTHYPHLSVWAKPDIADSIPINPFNEWGYLPRE